MADVPGFASDDNPKLARKGPADWQSPKAKTGKGAMIGCTLIALCAVGGVLVAILLYLQSGAVEPYLVTVPVGEYSDPAWPVNPWAGGDSELLAGAFKDRDNRGLAAQGFGFQQKDKFEGLLESIAAGTVEPDANGQTGTVITRPLVVHVSALGIARDSKVFLLPASARPGDPATWIPLEKLLDALHKCPASEKLLLLDLSKPLADPFLGGLRNDVGKELHAMLSARQSTLGYHVLTSCGPGETATVAEPAKCTAFALAVAEGLHGAADIYNPDGRGNDEVTVSELAQFVAARVHRYALHARNVRQTPQYYPPGGEKADFVLVRGKARKVEFPAARGTYPNELRTAWAKRDEAAASGVAKGYPTAFARLTAGILRAEETWYGSDRTDRVNSELANANRKWSEHVPQSTAGDPAADKLLRARQTVGTVRLMAARSKPEPPPADWGSALDAYLAARFAPVVPDKPSDAPKLREAWLAKAKGDPLDAAWLIWDRARQHARPKRADLEVYADAMKDLKVLGLKRDYSEIVLLRMLAGRNFRTVQNLLPDPGYVLTALLESEHELGLTLAAGPDGWNLIAAELADAEAARAEGQTALFTAGSAAKLTEADERLKRAAEKYRTAREAMVAWALANRVLQETTDLVVGTMAAALAYDLPSFAAWEQASDAVAALADRLDLARKSGRFQPAMAADLVKVAEAKAAVLSAAVGKAAVERLLAENKPRAVPADLVPWQAAATATLAPAGSRKAVWDALVGDLKKFHETVRTVDEEDFDKATMTPKPPALPPGDAEATPAANRAKASIALLRLGGDAKAGERRAKVERAIAGGSPKDFEALGEELRKAWSDEWSQRLQDDLQAGRWADANRLARATPPGATRLGRVADPLGDEPAAAKAMAQQVKAYHETAVGHFRTDRAYRARDDAGELFYAEATNLAPR